MNDTIRPRRLFVSGGSRLSPNAALLWRQLGALLAMEDGLTVITGGLAVRDDDPTALTADRMIIDGMLPKLESRGVASEERIETVLPDSRYDSHVSVRFKEGSVRVLQKRNTHARRFSMVHSADVVVSVEGESGSQSVLDVALAIERPVLPLPCGGGACEKAWRAQREEVVNWFRIDPKDADELEQIQLGNLSQAEIRKLASRVHGWVMQGFTQGCFVIMRFDPESDALFEQAIEPALADHGFRAWRTDRSVATGDVVEKIRDGISHCYFAIADTTGDRANVMYELGYAHACGKPVILLRGARPDGSSSRIPFDFRTQSVLKYTDDLQDLRGRLAAAIGMVCGKSVAGIGESQT